MQPIQTHAVVPVYKMKPIRGVCLRSCNECEIFKVTRADDKDGRVRMAAHLSNLFDQAFSAEDIYCDGCMVAGGRIFRFCEQCSIRRRELKNHS